MWNTGRHLNCYHAIPCMGAVLHTMNIRLGANELAYIINHAEDKVILVDADMLSNFERVFQSPENAKLVSGVELFIVCGLDEKPGGWSSELLPKEKTVDFDALIATEPDYFEWPELEVFLCSLKVKP